MVQLSLLNENRVSGSTVSMTLTGTELTLQNLSQGSYTFQFSATDNNNSTEKDEVNVTVLRDPNLPPFSRLKFITPNGDNSNDYWVLDHDLSRYSSCKLLILSMREKKYLKHWDT